MSHPLVRSALRAAGALATTLVLALGTGTQAHGAHPWPPMSCVTAQFTAIETSTDGQTAVHGQVTPCAPPGPNAVFALLAFPAGQFPAFVLADRRSLVTALPEGPTPFGGLFRSAPKAGQVGVCAMRTLTERIACVRVTFPEGAPATMEPISTKDPLVSAYVEYDSWEYPPPPPSGFCGSCLCFPTS